MNRKLFDSFFRKEEWAVKQVYKDYSRLIKHVSFQVLHDNDLCDDVVNETFIHVLKRGYVDGEKNLIPYMCATAHNLSINMVKERNRYESLNEEVTASNDEKSDNLLELLDQNLRKTNTTS